MDVLLQRHCAKYIYVVPEGLRELMSDISREVLRSQPEEIYSFIADYLDALLITRENARVAARLVESLTQMSTTIAELFIRTGMSRDEANKVASVIQTAFRKHLADKTAHKQQQVPVSEAVEEANIITEIIDQADITPEQAEQAAIIIQNAYRNFKHRQEREADLLKGMVDWRVAARSTMRLYRKIGVTYEEANRAATLIKAAYKGYYTRRLMKRILEESERVSEESMKTMEEEEGYEASLLSWERYGHDAEEAASMYEDIQEINKEDAVQEEALPEPEEDTETMVSNIVDNLLKRVVPDSATTIPTAVTPPPSEVESEGQPKVEVEGAETDATTEASPKTETSPEGSPDEAASPTGDITSPTEEPTSPGEESAAPTQEAGETGEAEAGETVEAEAGETVEAEAGETVEAEAGETVEGEVEAQTAESPVEETIESPTTEVTEDTTEVIMSLDAEASDVETDTENNDTTEATEMEDTTETEDA